jgi:hypothetical protein
MYLCNENAKTPNNNSLQSEKGVDIVVNLDRDIDQGCNFFSPDCLYRATKYHEHFKFDGLHATNVEHGR